MEAMIIELFILLLFVFGLGIAVGMHIQHRLKQ